MIDAFWLQDVTTGHKNTYECIAAFSATDFTEDLKRFDKLTLIIHGDDDQIVPIRHTFAWRLLQNRESLVYVKEQLGHHAYLSLRSASV